MSQTHLSFRETHLIGPRTREWIINAAQCPAFAPHRLTLIGWSDIRAPYRMVRHAPNYSHIIVGCGGEGRMWTEEGWRTLHADEAYLAPPGRPHAFEPRGGKTWRTVWAFYASTAGEPPLFRLPGPVIKPADAAPVLDLARQIHRETHGLRAAAVLHHLVGAFQQHVLRIRGAAFIDRRMLELTRLIEADLARAWTVRELAARLAVSEEHLRRLCLRYWQRSPMHHVAWLRMQRACALLLSGDAKLEAIAEMVGYANAFSFSSAFRRGMGLSPQAYRRAGGVAR